MISYMMRLRPFDKIYHFLGANISSVISMFRVACDYIQGDLFQI